MTSEAQRSFAGLTAPLPLRPPGLGMVGRLECDALLRMKLDVDRVADRSAQRGMAAREHDPLAEPDLEVDELAEKHLLIDLRLPDVAAFGPFLGEIDVLGPDRQHYAIALA